MIEEFKNQYSCGFSPDKSSVNNEIEDILHKISQILGFEIMHYTQSKGEMECRKDNCSYKDVEREINLLINSLKFKEKLCQNNGGQYE